MDELLTDRSAIMLSTLPSYSTISVSEPPEYSIVVGDTALLPPPSYVDSTGTFATHCSPETDPSLPPAKLRHVKQCIESWCTLFWILLLISLALLHTVLFVICFKCSLPKTSLSAIRAFFYLHIIFLIGMITYCCYKCKSRSVFTLNECVVATLINSIIPASISLLTFFGLTITDMVELNKAIQMSLSVTDTYLCSLTFYRLVFGVMIYNYIVGPLYMIMTATCLTFLKSTYFQRHLNLIVTQPRPEI
jgi:hypothetical protein